MRLAHSAPVRCAGCFCQKPGEPHVDFESAFEGPLVDPDRPRGGHVDWLVLCADCVRAAHGFLPDVADERDRLRAERDDKERELRELHNYVDSLEGAVAGRPASRGPKGPKKRRYEPVPQED